MRNSVGIGLAGLTATISLALSFAMPSVAASSVSYDEPIIPTPSSTSATPTPDIKYYDTCADVHAAGHRVLLRGQPGYRIELDLDHDGIGCEEVETTPVTKPIESSVAPQPRPVEANLPVTN